MRVGVEGTGSYGAGLARYLRRAGVEVLEVDRPNRQERRRKGKTDTVDAVEAARAARRNGSATPRARNRRVEGRRPPPNDCTQKPPGRTCLRCRPDPGVIGKVTRLRLNRGGDRQANSALWHIVTTGHEFADPRARASCGAARPSRASRKRRS